MTFLANNLQPDTNIEVFFSSDGSQTSTNVVYALGSTKNSRFSIVASKVNSTTSQYSISISSISASDLSYSVFIRCYIPGFYTSGGICTDSFSAYLAASKISSISTTTLASGDTSKSGNSSPGNQN